MDRLTREIRIEKFIGEQLRLARVACGRSLEEVGEEVRATRQYIHQIETGAKTPSAEMALALADAVGVRPRFLHVRFNPTVKLEQCHFRKQFTTPASLTSQVLARGTILDRLTGEIAARLELPAVDFPDIPSKDSEDIERAAEGARKHWRLGLGAPIISMTRVVENAGAIVTHFVGLSERVDALSMDRPRPIIIRSAAKESLCRLRFDIAHECGHLIMHRGVQTGDRETEEQANRFASAFLLPRTGFVKEFPRGRTLDWHALFELKLRWKVSVRAMVRRAFDLRLITAAQYRTANIHLVKTGQAKAERYDDEMPMEKPELLDRALDALEASRPGSVRTVAEDLGMGDGLFELLTGRRIPVEPLSKDNKIVDLTQRLSSR
jgi:Zn-dependent peptidase ImmA (M78 family)/DNA-binding XRE family transcriptional regulator